MVNGAKTLGNVRIGRLRRDPGQLRLPRNPAKLDRFVRPRALIRYDRDPPRKCAESDHSRFGRPNSGAQIWEFSPGGSGEFRATPAVDDADNVYLGNKDDQSSVLYAIKHDGTLLWQREIGADLYSSPALGDDRTIYVGSECTPPWSSSPLSHFCDRFHALDMATGAKKWSVQLDGDVNWSSPALSDAGVLYVGAMNGSVYAIRSDANRLLPNAGSPRFYEGNASTGRRQ